MNPSARALTLVLPLLLSLAACERAGSGHGHSHDDHDHGSGGHAHGDAAHAHGDEDGGPTTAFTLYTPTHELFVELDVPVAGQEGSYHAHVTRLSDNAPAAEGTFTVSFADAGAESRVARSFAAEGVARSGIFTPSGPAPQSPGRYRLLFGYRAGDESAEWDAGVIEVGTEPIEPPAQPEGDITFLKETSWKIPFRIERPTRERIARHVVVAARVEADPRATTVVGAPAAGRVLWSSGDAVTVAGVRVAAGQALGRLVPAASFESWGQQELALRQARIEDARARTEMARVEQLVGRGLLPDRRLSEARAAAESAAATLASAEGDARARTGADAGVALRAPRDGVVTELLVENGAAVRAGEPVARLSAGGAVIVRGFLRGADAARTIDTSAATVRVPGTDRALDLAAAGGEPLPVPSVVDPVTSGIAVAWRVPGAENLRIGEAVELHLAVGEAEESLSIPLGAVVEVNTRPYAFVQRTGESFERRALRLGSSDGRRVAVVEGISADDLVVTQGGFDVYVASLAGTVESHRH